MPPFVAGSALSAAFYAEVVRPLLGRTQHAAAFLGAGSDVLGYDTARSTDHDWGPRLVVFLDDPDRCAAFAAGLDERLPASFRGWPVRFGSDKARARHHVEVSTLSAWSTDRLGVDPTGGLPTLDWLLTPQQRLLEVVAGAVHADPAGALGRVRAALAWFPEPVWRWVLACQWHRLAEEESFETRTAEVGDDTGSAVVTARLVRDMMRLALLLERRYAPYQKWLGTAFARSPHHDGLPGHLAAAVRAPDAAGRESALAGSWTLLAHRHNAAGLTAPVEPTIRAYHDRPARVLMADRFAHALLGTVRDPALRAHPPIGSVDQIVDNTEVLSTPARYRRLATLYDLPGAPARQSA